MPRHVSAVILAVFAIQIIVRGVDYMDNDPMVKYTLSSMEMAMPLPVWGTLCIAAGSTVLAGMGTRRTYLVIAGSILAMAIFGALSAGAVIQMVTTLPFPWDGWRQPGDYISRCIIWGAFGWGTYIMGHARGRNGH